MMVRAVPLRDEPSGLALIEMPLVETDREGVDWGRTFLCGKSRERCGIDAAGEQYTDRNISNQVGLGPSQRTAPKSSGGKSLFILRAQ